MITKSQWDQKYSQWEYTVGVQKQPLSLPSLKTKEELTKPKIEKQKCSASFTTILLIIINNIHDDNQASSFKAFITIRIQSSIWNSSIATGLQQAINNHFSYSLGMSKHDNRSLKILAFFQAYLHQNSVQQFQIEDDTNYCYNYSDSLSCYHNPLMSNQWDLDLEWSNSCTKIHILRSI